MTMCNVKAVAHIDESAERYRHIGTKEAFLGVFQLFVLVLQPPTLLIWLSLAALINCTQTVVNNQLVNVEL